jgi:hypothetical protein
MKIDLKVSEGMKEREKKNDNQTNFPLRGQIVKNKFQRKSNL